MTYYMIVIVINTAGSLAYVTSVGTRTTRLFFAFSGMPKSFGFSFSNSVSPPPLDLIRLNFIVIPRPIVSLISIYFFGIPLLPSFIRNPVSPLIRSIMLTTPKLASLFPTLARTKLCIFMRDRDIRSANFAQTN